MAEEIDIVAQLRDAVSAPAARVEEALEDIGREADQADRSLAGVDRSGRKAAAGIDSTGRASRRTQKHLHEMAEEANDLDRNLDALTRAMGRAGTANRALDAALGGRGFNRAESRITRLRRALRGAEGDTTRLGRGLTRLNARLSKTTQTSALLGKVMSAIKLPLIITGVTLLSAAVAALGAAGFAAIAGLSPLVGLLGVAPALVAGLGQGMAVFKLGMDGVADAVKVLSDSSLTASEVAEKLKDTSPAVRHFAEQLVEANKGVKALKATVADNLLPGLAAGLQSVLPLMPILERNLAGTAGVLGGVGARGGQLVGSWGTDINTIMDRNTRMVGNFGGALLSVLTIFKNLAVAGGEQAERFSEWIERAAWNLNVLVDNGRNSGRLVRFFERAADLAATVGRFLGDIAVGLFNVGREADVMAGAMGSGVSDIASSFREWTESEEGRERIRRFFREATPVVMEFGRLVRDIVVGFGSLADNQDLLPVLVKLRTEALPAAMALADGISTQLGPALVDLVTAFLEFSNVLSFDPLITAANIVGQLATAVTGMITLTPGLSTFLATLVTLKLVAFLAGGALRLTGITWLLTKLPIAILATKGFTLALIGNTAAVNVNSAAQMRGAVIGGRLAKVFGLLRKATMLLWAVMLANPVGAIIVVVALLVAGIIALYKNSETARKVMNAALRSIAKAALWMVDKMIGAFQLVMETAGKMPGKMGAPFREAAEKMNVVRDKLDVIRDSVDELGRPKTVSLSIQISGAAELTRVRQEMDLMARGGTRGTMPGSAPTTTVTRRTQDRRLTAFSGGQFHTGQEVLTGELGPELLLFASGRQTVVGSAGPEVVRFAEPGYVVPAAGTPQEIADPIPTWVYERLAQTGKPAAAVPNWVEARVPTPAVAQDTGPGPYAPLPAPVINVYPQAPMDVEAAVERAYRRIAEQERERR